jgi:hypothetical protein
VLLGAACAASAQTLSGKTPSGAKFKLGTGPYHHQESPESIRKANEKRLARYMKLAESFLDKQRWQAAITNLKAAMGVPINDARRQKAYDLLKEVAGRAENAFDDARNLYLAGQYVEARDAAARAATDFRGVGAAAKAYRLIKKIDADPKAQAVLNEERARRLYQQAQRFRPLLKDHPEKIVDLYDGLKLLQQTRFRKTKAAGAARAELAKIEADTEAMARIAAFRVQREIESKMALANTYLKNGLVDKAVEIWNSIIAEHPDSEQAKLASKLKSSR